MFLNSFIAVISEQLIQFILLYNQPVGWKTLTLSILTEDAFWKNVVFPQKRSIKKIKYQFDRVKDPPGGYSTKSYTERPRPEVQPRTLLYTIFGRIDTPFVYLPLKNGTPFTYLLKNTASFF